MEVPQKFQPVDQIEIANVRLATFGTQGGMAQYIHPDDLDYLIEIGAYKPPISHHIGGHGDSWTAEPANGNGGPRFSAPNPYGQMWQIVETVPA